VVTTQNTPPCPMTPFFASGVNDSSQPALSGLDPEFPWACMPVLSTPAEQRQRWPCPRAGSPLPDQGAAGIGSAGVRRRCYFVEYVITADLNKMPSLPCEKVIEELVLDAATARPPKSTRFF
jgi:hypothetical protein